MSTQEDIYATGFENRPPMFNKDNYIPWSSRLLCYAMSKPNGKLLMNLIKNGPYVRQVIHKPGDSNSIPLVAESTHEQTNDKLTDIEAKQMEGVQSIKNQNGLIVVSRIAPLITNQNANQHVNGNVVAAWDEGNANGNNGDTDEIKEVNANCILMANLQQASTLGIQIGRAPIYDSDGSSEAKSREEVYFSNTSKMANVLKSFSIPNKEYSDDTPSVAWKFLSEVKDTLVTLQRVFKHRMNGNITNLSSLTHQEIHKIFKDEIIPLINQIDTRVQNFKNKFVKEAAEFVRDFTSLAKQAGDSLDKIKALEFENSRLLKAVQCLIDDNHVVCGHNYVNDMNSRAKKQKANVLNVVNQTKLKLKVMKPNKVGSKERLASPKPSKPRTYLRWSPTGRIFNFKGKIIALGRPNLFMVRRLGVLKTNLFMGNILIARVNFVEGLRYNLFSVGQFCNSDLEVTFKRNTYFIKNLDGVNLLKGSRTINLYTINLHEMAYASPICIITHATSTKSWLWHQRLSFLNFNIINDLAKNDLVTILPKLKYHKGHLCPTYEQGKRTKASHPPKPVPNSKQRSKDKAPEVIKTFLKKITILFQAPSIIKTTDNDTEFKNQVLQEYFVIVGISHQVSSVKTRQQNEVLEHRSQTLVEAARTMSIFSYASLFLWVKAIATACYSQNRSIIHRRFNKTPYKLINGRKPCISFLYVFKALCYPKNDREDLRKLGAKGLDLTYAPSTITSQKPTELDLDLLFETMYDDYIGSQPTASTKTSPAVQAHQVLHTPTATTTTADTAPTLTNSSSQAADIPNSSHVIDKLEKQPQHDS
nr:integrase, catalytic region, zinc finger, CCHC-type, peptidase aspartic, catalytic [Tanacetum cinerariifolium]